jgi:hypothetical protein
MKELQSYEQVDDNGSPAVTPVNSVDMFNTQDMEEDDPEGFIPYSHLPMPPGDDSDLTFQLGVGIGRVKKKLAEDEADIDETIVEVHVGRESTKRIKSPPRPERGDALSPSPSPKASGGGNKKLGETKAEGAKKKKKKKKVKPDEKRANVKLEKAGGGNKKLGESPMSASMRSTDFDSAALAPASSTTFESDTAPASSKTFESDITAPMKKTTSVKLVKKNSKDFEVPLGTIAGVKSTI